MRDPVVMQSRFEVPECRICIGRSRSFVIEGILPSLSIHEFPKEMSPVLAATEGYFTFHIAETNILAVHPMVGLPQIFQDYSNLSLSMLLEWVFFDKSYRPDLGAKRLSDIVAGDSSPEIIFDSIDENVQISWDLTAWTRGGSSYVTPMGIASISRLEYLLALSSLTETLIAAVECRAGFLGCDSEWRQWLSGYQPERTLFQEYLLSQLR